MASDVHRSVSCLLPFSGGILCLGLPFGYPGWRWEMLGLWLLLGGLLWWLSGWLRMATSTRGRARFSAGLFVILLAGYAYGSWRVDEALGSRLPDCADTRKRQFNILILSEPQLRVETGSGSSGTGSARFQAEVSGIGTDRCQFSGPYRLRLTWFGAPVLHQSQRWRVEGKLRPPWSYRNPGGFDYERWLLGAGLHGTGYITSGVLQQAADTSLSPVGRYRRELSRWVNDQAIGHPGLVLALMLGDDSAISREQWAALRRSGTIHLLVVSGLHVGLIAGLSYLVGGWLVRLWPGLLRVTTSKRAAACLAVVISGCYVILSGLGVPAVRAWSMSTLILLTAASGRLVSPVQILLIVLTLVLVSNPLVVFQQGFWLSFAAVFALLGFFIPRRVARRSEDESTTRPQRRWRQTLAARLWQFVLVQVVLFFALAPLLAVSQGSLPLISPLSNAFAVPVVTMGVLPLVLLVGLLLPLAPEAAAICLRVADRLLDFVMSGVDYLSALEPLTVIINNSLEGIIVLACVLILGSAPRWRSMVVALALWFALLQAQPDPPAMGHYRIRAFDVGQGTSILIETRHHSLIYDTGPAYVSGFNLGEAAVVPSVRQQGHEAIDGLILSHDDLDHTGGAPAVLQSLDPPIIWHSSSPQFAQQARRAQASLRVCDSGLSWRWDDVQFDFLSSTRESALPGTRSDNDSSCVLLVQAAARGAQDGHGVRDGRRALLAGDITKKVERRLPKISVDLLFAPHHGSRTSSSVGFISGFQPGVVFISAPRRSRYGHPHEAVMNRYRAGQSDVFVTGWHGSLRWGSERPNDVLALRAAGAYWHQPVWSPQD